eukprot:TRINITY_DN20625_c0_g1_i1.p1 TRINITY_DN20625_c0_g1~~TRINITY_DN20625_c0_g1_i1.p1  ORF type:complete len:300 (+),score=64.03 TRINITY_DN20625_c0_g1_i1:63-902(+)
MHRIARLGAHLTVQTCSGSTSAYSTITVEDRGTGVAVLTLSRPKTLNALNHLVMNEVLSALRALDADDGIRVIVITGSGDKAFAAGADIKEMNSRKFAEVMKMDMLWAWQGIMQVRKPLIAAVNGFALGGGCEVAMLCDIILASDKAKFGQPEINLGTIPGMGGTQRLTRAVGKSKAMEWILSGRQFTAQEAERAGLVSRVVAHESLMEEALQLAKEIAAKSQPVVAYAKQAVNQAFASSLSDGLLFEKQLFHSTWAIEDRREGMSAFTEKRPASFQHK